MCHPSCAVFAGSVAVLAAATALWVGEALARPLTNDEIQTFRSAPAFGQSDKVPDGLKRLQAAQSLAHKLGMEGNADAVPLLVDLRQTQILNTFAGAYSGPTTPELEALALRYMDEPELASRLVALLRQPRSPKTSPRRSSGCSSPFATRTSPGTASCVRRNYCACRTRWRARAAVKLPNCCVS